MIFVQQVTGQHHWPHHPQSCVRQCAQASRSPRSPQSPEPVRADSASRGETPPPRPPPRSDETCSSSVAANAPDKSVDNKYGSMKHPQKSVHQSACHAPSWLGSRRWSRDAWKQFICVKQALLAVFGHRCFVPLAALTAGTKRNGLRSTSTAGQTISVERQASMTQGRRLAVACGLICFRHVLAQPHAPDHLSNYLSAFSCNDGFTWANCLFSR